MKKCTAEAYRLIKALEAGYISQDFNLMGQSAHDLCSIVGQMGMQKTLNVSQQIEKACEDENISKINSLVLDFFYHFYNELPEME